MAQTIIDFEKNEEDIINHVKEKMKEKKYDSSLSKARVVRYIIANLDIDNIEIKNLE